jgi:hypothetical protein
MRTISVRQLFVTAIVAAAFIASSSLCFGGTITLSVLPASQTVGLGSQVTASLQIAGLGNLTAPSLGTFDVSLGFDPTVLSFSSAVFGDPILGDLLDPTGLGNTFSFISPGIGTVQLFDLSLASASQLDTLQPGSFVLARLVFDSVGAGTSPLDLTINALGDADGVSLAASVQNGSADISSVPEPNSLPLVTVGALVIALRCRRARSQVARRSTRRD